MMADVPEIMFRHDVGLSGRNNHDRQDAKVTLIGTVGIPRMVLWYGLGYSKSLSSNGALQQ
eukprot:5946888-Pyramimonas_sp.AAC.1